MLANLRDLRKEKSLSQKQMAERLCISQQTYSDYENGKTEPTIDTIIELSKIFNVSSDYLLGLVDEFGTPVITPEEKAAGASATKKISITPIEDEMLYVFREVGKTRGEPAQRAIIEMVEKML